MPKYYAVQNHGILRTWDECKAIVHGTSLQYKSFSVEQGAKEFLEKVEGRASKKRPKTADDDTPIFYVDGSHIKGTEKMGFGVYTCFKDIEYAHYQPGSTQWIADFVGNSVSPDVFKKVSNCTMEVLAAVYLLKFLADAKGVHGVLIRYDYEGVGCWLRGFWKRKEVYIDHICRIGIAALKTLQDRGVKIEWEWVRGHSGEEGNEKVDKIAKGDVPASAHPLSELNFAYTKKE